jgi:hypothetical protein
MSTKAFCTEGRARKAHGKFHGSLTAVLLLLQGWEWEGPWEIEAQGNVDPDGWAYAFEPGQFKWPPPPGAGNKKAHDFVRRCGK